MFGKVLYCIYFLSTLKKGCQYPEHVGDGYCQDYNNNKHCKFDLGDCCGPCPNTKNCTLCECKTENIEVTKIPLYEDDIKNPLIGDGYCNDETNNANCNYDGGDCCWENVNTEFCSECVCKIQQTCAFLLDTNVDYYYLLGDGVCDDEYNNPDCLYDGLDCCGQNVFTFFCSECICHSM